MRTDKERPEENTCRIVKGLDAVWAYFCPSKPCLPLLTDGIHAVVHSAAELEQLIDLFKRSGAGLVNVARSLLVAVMQHGVYPGFGRIVPRHGIYVCDWAEFGNVDTLISVLKYQGGKLDKGTAASLLETRTAVEGLAARLFISRCTNADILALRSIINDFRAEAQVKPRADVDKLAELACSFHRYICVKSGNNVIPLIVNGFHDVNMALWTLWIRQVGPRAAGDVLDELLYYITTGNSDGAVGFYGEDANEFLSKI